jgi:hypothetical protein
MRETRAYVSGTISNFRDKLWAKYPPYRGWRDILAPTVFFGLYHPGDYRRYLLHRGPKLAVWCGSDILRLKDRPVWRRLLARSGRHLCENESEQGKLEKAGISADVRPLFFGNARRYSDSTYVASKDPHVYLSMHPGREKEYGYYEVLELAGEFPHITFNIFGISGENPLPNVKLWGHLPEDTFDEVTAIMQASLRFNRFDGFSEVTAKAVLRGQHAWSRIQYKHLEEHWDVRLFLEQLSGRMAPPASRTAIWRHLLNYKPQP